MLRALVTGGCGFIGSHIAELLLHSGYDVRVIDNASTGSLENLASFRGEIEYLEGDVRDEAACQAACRDVDVVFHLAGMASVEDSVADPRLSHDVNLTGTLNMLVAARDAGATRFVFSSSTSVYGNAREVPTQEDQPLSPLSPYASQKAASEMYCRNFHALYGLETVVLRYFNVFGPRQNAESGYAAAIPKFIQAAIRNESPTIYGDGLQTRDFVFVSNVARANLLAAQVSGVAGETFNIASGDSISLLDLLAELRAVTGNPLLPNFQAGRAGEVRHSRADIRRARERLGYSPEVTFAEGIRQTVEEAQALLASAG